MGAPFFPGVGCGVVEGIAVGCGLSVGLGDGASSGATVSDGDAPGVGVGDPFLRFRSVSGVGLGDGVGDAFFRFGEAVGAGLGVGFFADRFRCFRAGVGVGVVVKNFLIFLPNGSSALLGVTIAPAQIAAIRKIRNVVLEVRFVGRFCETPIAPASDTHALEFASVPLTLVGGLLVTGNKISGRAPVELLCSCECHLRDFREGNSRWESARGNREGRVPSAVSRCPGCCETARQSGCCHLHE